MRDSDIGGLRWFIEQADSLLERCSSPDTVVAELEVEAQTWSLASYYWLRAKAPGLLDHWGEGPLSDRSSLVEVPAAVRPKKLWNMFVMTTWYRNDLARVERLLAAT